mmetsp:Transcript_15517/g.44804  ORF Transcript_15517/g.44804 Transcript_15517/m.44804 type:complete len:434 (-) Transcript_15517:244-1545(-)
MQGPPDVVLHLKQRRLQVGLPPHDLLECLPDDVVHPLHRSLAQQHVDVDADRLHRGGGCPGQSGERIAGPSEPLLFQCSFDGDDTVRHLAKQVAQLRLAVGERPEALADVDVPAGSACLHQRIEVRAHSVQALGDVARRWGDDGAHLAEQVGGGVPLHAELLVHPDLHCGRVVGQVLQRGAQFRLPPLDVSQARALGGLPRRTFPQLGVHVGAQRLEQLRRVVAQLGERQRGNPSLDLLHELFPLTGEGRRQRHARSTIARFGLAAQDLDLNPAQGALQLVQLKAVRPLPDSLLPLAPHCGDLRGPLLALQRHLLEDVVLEGGDFLVPFVHRLLELLLQWPPGRHCLRPAPLLRVGLRAVLPTVRHLHEHGRRPRGEAGGGTLGRRQPHCPVAGHRRRLPAAERKCLGPHWLRRCGNRALPLRLGRHQDSCRA